MPLIAHNDLPAFERLRGEGYDVLGPDEALRQDIRELHIGFLNLMPDAALRATERQFLRLLGACNRIVQIRVHLLTAGEPSRGGAARAHLARHYEPFEAVHRRGLDGLIITGANPASSDLQGEDFWTPLARAFDWAAENVASTLCSCLASHAALQHFYGLERQRRPTKRWGVFPHRVTGGDHPLTRHVNTRFDVPRSHRFEIGRQQITDAGCTILVDGVDGVDGGQDEDTLGWHLAAGPAASPGDLRFIFCQGHPEYDTESLLKEYKREVERYVAGERDHYPPLPEGYFTPDAQSLLDEHRGCVTRARHRGDAAPAFPEDSLRPLLENTWTDTGKAIVGNWLGEVYRRLS